MALGGKSAGSVSIRVLPDSTKFRADLKKVLERAERQFQANIKVDADTTKFDDSIRKLQAEFAGKSWNIDVDANVRAAQQKLQDLAKNRKIEVKTDVDAAKARASLAVLARNRIVELTVLVSKTSLAKVGATLAALSGARVLTRSLSGIGEALANTDRSLPKLAAVGLSIASIGSLALSSVGGLTTLATSLVSVAGIAGAVPGLFVAAGAGVGVLIAALKDAPTVLKSTGQQFKQLQNVISKNFWAQAAAPIRELVNNLMPTLRSQLGGVASELGAVVSSFTSGFGTVLNSKAVSTFLSALQTGLAAASDGAQSLGLAFGRLIAFGGQYLPQIGSAFSDLANQFATFVARITSDGSLEKWVANGLTALQQIGSVLSSALSIISGIASAASAAGGGGLATLAAVFQQIATVVNSPAFQGALTTVFQGAAAGAQGLATMLAPIGQMFQALAPTISQVMTLAGQALGQLGTVLANSLASPAIQQGLVALFQGIAAGLAAIGPAIPGIATAFGSIMQVAGVLAGTLGQVLSAAFSALVPVVMQLAAAITPLIPMLGSALISVIQSLVPILTALIPPIVQIATQFLSVLLPAVTQLAPIFAQLAIQVGQVLLQALAAIVPILPQIVTAFLQLVQATVPLIPQILQIAQALIPLIPAILQLIPPVLQLATMLMQMGVQAQAAIQGILLPALKMVVSGITSMYGIVSGILNALVALFHGNMGQAQAAISGAVNSMLGVFRAGMGGMLGVVVSAFGRITSAVSSAVGKVVSLVSGLAGKITSAVAGFGKLLYSAGVNLIQGLMNGIGSMVGALVSKATSIAGSAVSAVKGALGIHSPSTVFATIGRYIGQGLVKGLTGSQQSVATATSKLAQLVNDTYTKRTQQLQQYNRTLTTLEERRATAARKAAEAEAQLGQKGLTQSRRTSLTNQIANYKDEIAKINQQIRFNKQDQNALQNLTAGVRDSILKGLASKTDVLKSIAAQRDSIAQKIKDATTNLQNAIKIRDDFAANVRDSINQLGDVTSFGDQSTGRTATSGIISGLKTALAQAQHFRSLIQQLQKAGLGQTALQQIVAKGAEAGSAAAQAILSGGKSAIAQVNSLQQQLDSVGASLGGFAADAFYQSGVNAAQGLLNGLKSQQSALQKLASQIAATLATAVKKTLGIHSPSRVFRDDIGKQIVAGLILGITQQQSQVDAAMSRLVQVPNLPGFAAGTVFQPDNAARQAGADRSVQQTNYITQPEDPRIIARQLGRNLQAILV